MDQLSAIHRHHDLCLYSGVSQGLSSRLWTYLMIDRIRDSFIAPVGVHFILDFLVSLLLPIKLHSKDLASCSLYIMIKFHLLLQLKYLLQCLWSLPRLKLLMLKLLLSQYNFNSSICSNLQCCYSSSIAVRAVVNTVNTLAVQVLLV